MIPEHIYYCPGCRKVSEENDLLAQGCEGTHLKYVLDEPHVTRHYITQGGNVILIGDEDE